MLDNQVQRIQRWSIRYPVRDGFNGRYLLLKIRKPLNPPHPLFCRVLRMSYCGSMPASREARTRE